MQFFLHDSHVYEIFYSCLLENKPPHCGKGEKWDYFQGLIAAADHWKCQLDIQEATTRWRLGWIGFGWGGGRRNPTISDLK